MAEEGLTLSPIICDGMILQRDAINHIYGADSMAELVTVHFMDQVYRTAVDENKEFCIELPPVAAGGPYVMTVRGSSEITISDILFGDVYILSGQSNMELPIRRVLDVSAEEIKHTYEPTIRQYLIPATYNFKEPEKYMYAGQWNKAYDSELMGFSAAGYFFAKEIKEAYQVPIGLIMTAVGGSAVEAWMNPVSLREFGDYDSLIEDFKDISYFNQYIQAQQQSADDWYSRMEAGEQKFTPSEDYKKWSTCRVPSLVSDYCSDDFSGSVYLCREVMIEAEPEEEDAYIYMGSIIDSDQVWINGALVGRTQYRYPPRKYGIKKGILKKGINLITVRVVINNGNGGTISGKPYRLYCDGRSYPLEGEWYYRLGKKMEAGMPSVLFPPTLPVCFYHTVVVPLSKISVKGVLWYQGEHNTQQPANYERKFSAMVSDWRELFGWEVPVIYVQLANYREPLNTAEDTGWAELRDQQRRSLSLYHVAMVVAMDIGEPNDLHPQNKKELGVRLARAAKYLIYNETLVHSGPIPERSYVLGNKVEIEFRYLEDGETEKKLNNFELAGEDGEFYQASATQKGNRVSLVCDQVEKPRAVRYAWSDCPRDLNFYNEESLPAAGFCSQVCSRKEGSYESKYKL